MPARRSSSSSIKPRGSRAVALAVLDAEAIFAIGFDYTAPSRHGHKVEWPVKALLLSTPTGPYSAADPHQAPLGGVVVGVGSF